MLSATSYTIQHWKFVVVTDTKLRKAIREASIGSWAAVGDSRPVVAVSGDGGV